MVGAVELAEFEGLKKLPQKAASAAAVLADPELVGVSYKPVLYVGTKVTKGVNHVFIAEQTRMTNPAVRRLVRVEVNEFRNVFEIVKGSIVQIA